MTPRSVTYTQNEFPCPEAIKENEIANRMMLNLLVFSEFKRL